MKTFFKVCNPTSEQGLWYRPDGTFAGLIHDKFDFCKNSEIKMDFDEELVGWLSATDSLDNLWQWFPKEDIVKLQEHGWFIHIYETEEYKFYERFQHFVINQTTSKLLSTIKL